MQNLPRADHVGSLLRPSPLRSAHKARAAGEIDDAALESVVADCIREAVTRQQDAGLEVVTDGEFRRGSWFLGFVEAVDGIELRKAELQFTINGEEAASWYGPAIAGKLARKRDIVAEDYRFLAGVTQRIAKVTLPTPSLFHFFGGKNVLTDSPYADVEDFGADIARIYREELAALYEAGCRYVQLDEVPLALLCDESIRASLTARGEDPDRLIDIYARMTNDALAGRPKDMRVGMHLCRGNYKGRWMGEGGYDRIAERLFNAIDVDAYLLEYDSERAGGFEPLRDLPDGKRAYLGLVSSKTGALEPLDDLRRKLDQAARHAPLERLGVCPQCGFASSAGGNPLTEDEQWAKLKRVADLARVVWG